MLERNNNKSLFWISYADLMTSMFFVMLVLFVVAFTAFRIEVVNHSPTVNVDSLYLRIDSLTDELTKAKANEKQLQGRLNDANATIEQVQQILNLQNQFSTLSKSTSLAYDPDKKMFYAKDFIGKEIFNPDEDTIKPEYISDVDRVGHDLESIIGQLHNSNSQSKYLLVIEGTAAIPYDELKAGTFNPDNREMYLLSYRRALALYNRWKNLKFRDYNTEIIIAGSGFNGVNRDLLNEDNNKRFIIQIIPKVDKPETK